mmetsp:Transcript_17878/g.55734  ORF Transcript_17878/g.55734 Transcript_17878/m.55734 type:complete len:572 (+) Transcript_17878:668-2383(+)
MEGRCGALDQCAEARGEAHVAPRVGLEERALARAEEFLLRERPIVLVRELRIREVAHPRHRRSERGGDVRRRRRVPLQEVRRDVRQLHERAVRRAFALRRSHEIRVLRVEHHRPREAVALPRDGVGRPMEVGHAQRHEELDRDPTQEEEALAPRPGAAGRVAGQPGHERRVVGGEREKERDGRDARERKRVVDALGHGKRRERVEANRQAREDLPADAARFQEDERQRHAAVEREAPERDGDEKQRADAFLHGGPGHAPRDPLRLEAQEDVSDDAAREPVVVPLPEAREDVDDGHLGPQRQEDAPARRGGGAVVGRGPAPSPEEAPDRRVERVLGARARGGREEEEEHEEVVVVHEGERRPEDLAEVEEEEGPGREGEREADRGNCAARDARERIKRHALRRRRHGPHERLELVEGEPRVGARRHRRRRRVRRAVPEAYVRVAHHGVERDSPGRQHGGRAVAVSWGGAVFLAGSRGGAVFVAGSWGGAVFVAGRRLLRRLLLARRLDRAASEGHRVDKGSQANSFCPACVAPTGRLKRQTRQGRPRQGRAGVPAFPGRSSRARRCEAIPAR